MDVTADVVQRHGACCGRLRGETGEAHFYRAHVALQGGDLLLQHSEFATQGNFVSAVPGVMVVAITVIRTGLVDQFFNSVQKVKTEAFAYAGVPFAFSDMFIPMSS